MRQGRKGREYPRDENRTGLDVQIDEKKDDTALTIVSDAIDDHLGPDIVQLDKGGIPLVAVSLDGLVDFFIVSNALSKVLHGRHRVDIDIIRTAQLHFPDIGQDQRLIVTDGLYEQDLLSKSPSPSRGLVPRRLPFGTPDGSYLDAGWWCWWHRKWPLGPRYPSATSTCPPRRTVRLLL